MTFKPLAITNCSVVELLLQVFALVYGSYGERHCCIAKILSIRNNMIPPQLLQRTTKVMLAPNLNLSMLLSQYAETMLPTCRSHWILPRTYCLSKCALPSTTACWRDPCCLLSYGQHDIKWCQQFTAHQLSTVGSKPATPLYKALYKTLMDVKRKVDCEQPLERSTS